MLTLIILTDSLLLQNFKVESYLWKFLNLLLIDKIGDAKVRIQKIPQMKLYVEHYHTTLMV